MVCLIKTTFRRRSRMTKRSKTKPVYKKVRVGTSHFLRGGAGAHVDKKKELQKKLCRIKPQQDE